MRASSKGNHFLKSYIALLAITLAACGSSDEGDTQPESGKPANMKGPYSVGDVYDDGEFRAKYLGLARLSLGSGSPWPDGECYAFLVEASRYNDHLNSGGVDTFSPATSGILSDGGKAERDSSGVGCNTKPLRELGYQSTHKAKLKVGESAKVYTGTFRLGEGQLQALQGVELYGKSGLFLPEVTVEALASK